MPDSMANDEQPADCTGRNDCCCCCCCVVRRLERRYGPTWYSAYKYAYLAWLCCTGVITTVKQGSVTSTTLTPEYAGTISLNKTKQINIVPSYTLPTTYSGTVSLNKTKQINIAAFYSAGS